MPLFREGISGDSLSLASYHLKMIPNGTEEYLATGTGFFYEYENKYYLITNACRMKPKKRVGQNDCNKGNSAKGNVR